MGYINTRGVYVYEETDTDAKASDLLNRAGTAAATLLTPAQLDALNTVGNKTGWSVVSGQFVRRGFDRALALVVQRTGSAVTVTAGGGIDTGGLCATLLSARDYPLVATPLTHGNSTRMAGAFLAAGNGDITLKTTAPGVNISTGTNIALLGSWIAGQL